MHYFLSMIVLLPAVVSNGEITSVYKRELSVQNAEYIKEIRGTLKNLEKNLKNSKCNDKNACARTSDNGGVYTRWGKTKCRTGSDLVYAGQAAGSHYNHPGAAVNYLCMPAAPLWGHYDSNMNNRAFVYGAQYGMGKINVLSTPWQHSKYNIQGVPCAVCKAKGRTSILMIPGRNKCYSGWTIEYHGYLGAGYHGNKAASEYQCIDQKPEIYPQNKNDHFGKVFTSVEAMCDGLLACPPYVNGRELTCVVCSK